MTAVLAHVDDAVGTIDDDLDLDLSLAACVQRSLAAKPATNFCTRPYISRHFTVAPVAERR